MRDQLVHLEKLSRKRNVQIQVLPFDASTSVVRVTYRFTLLQIPSPGTASPLEFAYVKSLDDARCLDDKETVRTYVNLWNRLQAAALGPAESRRFIGEVAEQFVQAT